MNRLTDTDLKNLQAYLDKTGSPVGFKPSPVVRKKRDNRESRMQKMVVRWWVKAAAGFSLPKELLVAVPNGAVYGFGTERIIRAKILLDEGMRPGYPDLILDAPRGLYHGLRIEMKLPEGVVSDDQTEMHRLLRHQGYAVEVCRSTGEAIDAITKYLKG